jgi:hypothetical protein
LSQIKLVSVPVSFVTQALPVILQAVGVTVIVDADQECAALGVEECGHEALASYLRRLASLNSLDGDELWRRVTTSASGSRLRRSPAVPAVAALAGREPAALAAALPELRDPPPDWESLRHAPQAGCPRCDAGHPGGQVLRLLPHHEYACTRHRYWIGPPDINRPGPSLPGHPEIITAQRRHRKLVHQHGWALAYDGVLTGLMICAHLWQDHAIAGLKPAWDRRRQDLIPPGQLETVHPLSQARHDTSARRLASGDRPPGRIILTHRVIQPVLIRQWSIPMDNINGAIWQSQRTETRKFAELTRTTNPQTIRVNIASRRSAAQPIAAFNRNGHS